MLKAAREKQQVTYKGNPICLTADLPAETLQFRRKLQDIIKVLRGKNLQPRLLYPERISFKIVGEIKSFSDKQKRIQYHQTSFPTNVKETYTVKRNKREKSLQNQPQTIKKITIGTYISITTLNLNGLNAPTKRHRLAEWIQKQDPCTCCLQETYFRPKDTYRLKVRGLKNIFLPLTWNIFQLGSKRKLEYQSSYQPE